jgi:hypothetical protein
LIETRGRTTVREFAATIALSGILIIQLIRQSLGFIFQRLDAGITASPQFRR